MDRIKWTPDKIEVLKALYPSGSDASVAEALGFKVTAVQSKAKRIRLRKSPAYLKELNAEKARKRHEARRTLLGEPVMPGVKPGRIRHYSTCGL